MAVTGAGSLVTTVLDIVHNEWEILLIVQLKHMPDLLIYREHAEIENLKTGDHHYVVAGINSSSHLPYGLLMQSDS